MSKNTNKADQQNQQKEQVIETTATTVETNVNTEATTVPENPPVANPETTVEPQISETATESAETAEPQQAAVTNDVDITVTVNNVKEDNKEDKNMTYKESRAKAFHDAMNAHGLDNATIAAILSDGIASGEFTAEDLKALNKTAAEKQSSDERNQKTADKAAKQPMSTKKKILITAAAVAGAGAAVAGGVALYKHFKHKSDFENELGCESGEDLGICGYIPEIPDDPFA